MPISTANATMMTRAEMIKPWIMGLMPDFLISLTLVLSPMAANAATIKNLLDTRMVVEIATGIRPILLTIAMAKKPRINQGMIEETLEKEGLV